MSWSLNAAVDEASGVMEALVKAKDTALETQPFDSWDDDIEAQMLSAFDAVAALAGAVEEGKGHTLSVRCSGHARRNEADYVTIGVSIISAPKPKPTKK